MSSVILRGYYGHQNAGDDAFLAVSAWAARQYGGYTHVMVAAQRASKTYGVPVKPMFGMRRGRGRGLWNRARDLWMSCQSDGVIFGGGSNFHSTASLRHFSRVVKVARPGLHFAAGVSIGPFRDPGAEAACGRLLKQLAFVGVRDRASYERARRLAPGARVELTFDLAPLLPRATGYDRMECPEVRRGLGIALCNYERFTGGDLEREAERIQIVAEAIRRCAARRLIDEVTLIDFNGHCLMGDHDVHRELASRIGTAARVHQLAYIDDPLTTMRAVAGMRGILAMRLHAAVFAFCTHTPTLMLAYHEKCHEWADMIGLPPCLFADAYRVDAGELADRLECLLCEPPPILALDPETAVERAMMNWEWIRQ